MDILGSLHSTYFTSFLGTPWQITMDWLAYTTEACFSIVPEAKVKVFFFLCLLPLLSYDCLLHGVPPICEHPC